MVNTLPEPLACLRVGVLPLPNFTLVALAGFVDMLRLSADEGDRSRPLACRWAIIAPQRHPIRSSCGAELIPREELGDPARFDYVAVVGGLLPPPEREFLDPRSGAFLRAAHAAGLGVIGICTGSFALVEAKLIRHGDPCCVSWYHYQDLQQRYPKVRPVGDRLWVRNGRVITCAGGTAAVDLAASLVQQHIGGSVARKSLHIMLVDGARGSSAAQPQPVVTVEVYDPRVRRAMLLMEQNLSHPLTPEALAKAVGMSRRQLERLFREELHCSLQAFNRDLRLSYAVWLMGHSRARISEIAQNCGFADTPHFSRSFTAAFGHSPSAARAEGGEPLQQRLEAWWPHGWGTNRPGDPARHTELRAAAPVQPRNSRAASARKSQA